MERLRLSDRGQLLACEPWIEGHVAGVSSILYAVLQGTVMRIELQCSSTRWKGCFPTHVIAGQDLEGALARRATRPPDERQNGLHSITTVSEAGG